MPVRGIALGLAFAAAFLIVSAHAQTVPGDQADASAASDTLRPLCPDRPGKNTSACTVDAGYFQVEVDVFDTSFSRSGTVDTTTTLVASPLLKYGIDDTADLEIQFTPWLSTRSFDRATGMRTSSSGFGDILLRAKFMLTPQGGDFSAALAPYIKLPTASDHLGDGTVEGGVVAPLDWTLSDDWSLASTPELDVLKDQSGASHHVALVDVVGINRSIGEVTLGAELWGSVAFDPAGTTSQYSFDLNGAWQPAALNDIQFDAGVNFGLNDETPGSELYVGISRRL